jgi:hypothetical protein
MSAAARKRIAAAQLTGEGRKIGIPYGANPETCPVRIVQEWVESALHPSSKGARVHFSGKNRTVTDGPFAETKEMKPATRPSRTQTNGDIRDLLAR